LFTIHSSQVASADVLGEQILSFRREQDKRFEPQFFQNVLPPPRFAAVNGEQIEWLKKRNAASSTDDEMQADGSTH
jgi:hypothetical protein